MNDIDKFVEESLPRREDYRVTCSLGGGVYDYGKQECGRCEWTNIFSCEGDGSGNGEGSSDTIDNGYYVNDI